MVAKLYCTYTVKTLAVKKFWQIWRITYTAFHQVNSPKFFHQTSYSPYSPNISLPSKSFTIWYIVKDFGGTPVMSLSQNLFIGSSNNITIMFISS